MKVGQFVKIKNVITGIETTYRITRISKEISGVKVTLLATVHDEKELIMPVKKYRTLEKAGVIIEL